MRAFTVHTGLVAPMDRNDVDTDQLMPKQFLKKNRANRIRSVPFFDWRFLEDGSDNPDFELNRPEMKGASVLLARRNFGCGSSREHAPWGLDDYGFRVILASSFADIFYNNCFKNGMLPIPLEDTVIEDLFQRAAQYEGYKLTVDLEKCVITDEHGLSIPIEDRVDSFRRECLLNGWDDIALTLRHEEKITEYEKANSK